MEKTIGPQSPATIEFHVARPGGWAAGNYKVDVPADGTFIVTRESVVN